MADRTTRPSAAEDLAAGVLFAPLRRQQILDQLTRRGRVEAARLAADLGVSTESIRKDLTVLEQRGLLRRVHGGAIAHSALAADLTGEPAAAPPVSGRSEFAAAKTAIAVAALAHLPASGSILLDAGSTTFRLAELLPDKALVVATTSLPIASTVARIPAVTVHSTGGVLRRPHLAGVGQVPLNALAALNVDVAFLSTDAVSFERGLTTTDEQEATVKNRMLRCARRRILLVDSSKFGRERLWRHAAISDINLLITDAGLSADDRRRLSDAGVEVEVAGAARHR